MVLDARPVENAPTTGADLVSTRARTTRTIGGASTAPSETSPRNGCSENPGWQDVRGHAARSDPVAVADEQGDGPALGTLGRPLVVVVEAKFLIGGLVRDDVVGDVEERMSNGEDGLLLAPAAGDAPIAGCQGAARDATSRVGARGGRKGQRRQGTPVRGAPHWRRVIERATASWPRRLPSSPSSWRLRACPSSWRTSSRTRTWPRRSSPS